VERDPATDLLRVNREFTVSLILSRCKLLESGRARWKVRFDTGLQPDISVVDARTVYRRRHVAIDAAVIRRAITVSRAEAEEYAEPWAVVAIEPWPHDLDARPGRDVAAVGVRPATIVATIPSIVSATVSVVLATLNLTAGLILAGVVACRAIVVVAALIARAVLLIARAILLIA
jgi:hypothetical protein